MIQSRSDSLKEAVISNSIGVVLAYFAQVFVFPLYGIHNVSPLTNLQLTAIFTVLSIIRSYCVRRFFNYREQKALNAKAWRS